MKIPKNVCDKVVYIDQDDGSTGTIPASNGNYDLRSRHDFEHSSQGNYKKRDYICYSRGKGAAFNFSQIAGYWQHVDTQVVLGSNAIDGRANIFVDGVKIPCGNDDETKHYWRVYWNSTVGPGGMSKCPNSKVYCIDAGYLHLCSNNGFKSDAPSDVSVHANWKRIYFQGIESGHSASTTTHYYINMNITHVDTSANPTLTDSLLLISPPMFGGQIYDAAGVPFLPTATNILSSQDGSWYRAAKPNYYDDISLKLQIGLSKDAQDQLLKDGTYTCSALVKSKNDPHTISIHNVIIKKSYSYLNKSIAIDASHQNYKFLDAGTHSFYGDKKSINLELTVTCQNGHKDQDINFYPQKIQLYKVKHFRDY